MKRYQFKRLNRTTICAGYTIMELLICIAMLVILTSIAVPSFASMVNNGKIKTSSMLVSTALAASRHYALNTGITVIVCHARDPLMTSCSESRKRNTNWSNGIISYADLNQNNSLDQTDQIIFSAQTQDNVAIVFNQNGRLRFFPSGGSRSAGFYLCSKHSKYERHIKILHTGRTRTLLEMDKNRRHTCLSKAG